MFRASHKNIQRSTKETARSLYFNSRRKLLLEGSSRGFKTITKATRQTDLKLTIQHMIKRKTKILTLFCDATIKGFYYTSF